MAYICNPEKNYCLITFVNIIDKTNKMTKRIEEKKQECIDLLLSTERENVETLITYLNNIGYFVAAGSLNHHRFEGGLLSHSLETYHKAMELREKKIASGCDPQSMPIESVIIACLMHDLCKADVLRFNHTTYRVDEVKSYHGHSARSVRKLGYAGFKLTSAERDAILWHMGGRRFKEDRNSHFKSHPLSEVVYNADKESIREAKKRNYK